MPGELRAARRLPSRGALRRADSVPSGDGSRCFSRFLPSYPAEPSGSCPAEELRAARLLLPFFPSGRKFPSPLAAYRSSSPRMHGSRRTRWGSVRVGKTQLFESVRMARVIRGGSLRTRTEAQADGRVSKSGDDLRKGWSGGMEGGAGGGTPFPITRPPSPVRRTHHLKREYELTRSRPRASRHNFKALAFFRLLLS